MADETIDPGSAAPSSFAYDLRLVWADLGIIILFACALITVPLRLPWLGTFDVLFLCTTVVIAGARFVHIERFGARTEDGRPQASSDWGRYLPTLIPAAVAVRLAALSHASWMDQP